MTGAQFAAWMLCGLVAGGAAASIALLALWLWSRSAGPIAPDTVRIVDDAPLPRPSSPPRLEAVPSRAEMLALKASAQFAHAEFYRTGAEIPNPYPPGSRKAIVWSTFYCDAQLEGEQA